MTSPKDALERVAKFYPEHPAWCNSKIDTSGVCDCFLDSVHAAIPVAELYEQAVLLLQNARQWADRKTPWFNKVNALLTRLKALK